MKKNQTKYDSTDEIQDEALVDEDNLSIETDDTKELGKKKSKYCSNCGNKLSVNANFCDICGSSVNNKSGLIKLKKETEREEI